MRIKRLLVLLLFVLMCSCSIFKKKIKTIDKYVETERIDVRQQERSVEDRMVSEVKVDRQERELDEQTLVMADSIEFRVDGSLLAKGNAKVQKKLNTKEKASANEIKSAHISVAVQNEELRVEENMVKEEQNSIVESPSGKGIMYGLGAVLLVVFAFCWWFGLRRR